ncbi:hypothetical protein ACIP6Q_28000 [Streptomyces bobili]|uniref:hypothetical protein n=1 Tax=Streptomyces bobili TaxID=67280 RepID=UPI0036ED0FB3
MADETSVLMPVIIVAALVIRDAFTEIRRPGSARRDWTFVTKWRAMAAAGVVAVTVTALGWNQAGWAALAWALLAGTLSACLIGRDSG